MENNVNEVVEMTEDVVEEVGTKLTGMKPEGKWIAVGAAGATLLISAGVGIKKLIDAKKVSKELTENVDKKPWLERLPKIHFGKKSKETTEDVTEEKPEE